MTYSLAYWILMLIWLLFSGWSGFRPGGDRLSFGNSLLLFLLLLIAGLKIFGTPLHG